MAHGTDIPTPIFALVVILDDDEDALGAKTSAAPLGEAVYLGRPAVTVTSSVLTDHTIEGL
jgi:hypothetical protein